MAQEGTHGQATVTKFAIHDVNSDLLILNYKLQGNNVTQEYEPRRSWLMRKRQERAAMKEGLAEWQANPYFCAGRVTVPALMDTVACQCFINT